MKYFHTLQGLNENHFLRQALNTSIELDKKGIYSWYSCISYIKNQLKIDINNFCSDKQKRILI